MNMCKFSTGKSIPCCWALLPSKSEDTYQLMLGAVLRKVNRDGREDYKASILSVDFEIVAIKILNARFPGSKITWLHLQYEPGWIKLQKIDLISFHKDADFWEFVYMVYALSFVTVDKIVDYNEKVIL
jgi:hypothetical protein